MKQYFLFVEPTLTKEMSSIENSVLKRYKLFQQFLNITPIYLSLDFNLNVKSDVAYLKSKNKITDNFNYVNLFEFWLQTKNKRQSPKQEILKNEEITLLNENLQKSVVKIYHKQTGFLSAVKFYDDKGCCYKINQHDRFGCLAISTLLDEKNKVKKSVNYYRQDGTVAAYLSYRRKNGKNTLFHAVTFDKNGEFERSFATEEKFIFYLLENYLSHFSADNQLNIFIDKHHYFAKFMKDSKNIKAKWKEFHIFHGIHQYDPYAEKSEGRANFLRDGLYKELDGIIFLTPEQADDFKIAYSDYGNVFCIPHSIELSESKVEYNRRIPHRVIAVMRLSEEKRIDRMIRIFAKVVEEIPTAQLDIYGDGIERTALANLIVQLQLQKNVHLRGFTHNVQAEFETAQCSLLTSFCEAQPLVILESFTYGCPVISFDLKYGPKLMINNGKNGYLVPMDNDEQMVERIVYLLQHSEVAELLSKFTYESAKRFNPEYIAPLWKGLVDKINM